MQDLFFGVGKQTAGLGCANVLDVPQKVHSGFLPKELAKIRGAITRTRSDIRKGDPFSIMCSNVFHGISDRIRLLFKGG